jgi:hypothetical protein
VLLGGFYGRDGGSMTGVSGSDPMVSEVATKDGIGGTLGAG